MLSSSKLQMKLKCALEYNEMMTVCRILYPQYDHAVQRTSVTQVRPQTQT